MSDNTPGWQPDPTGKHDHRYWDGTQWTENVADAGVAGVDPYEAAAAGPEVPADAEVPPEAPAGLDEPTVVDQQPAAPDATEAYPTTVEQPAAWGTPDPATGAPAPPPPYVPTEPADGGGSRRGLLIGGGILAAVAVAVIAFLSLGGDDDGSDTKDPISDATDNTADDTTDTTAPPREGSYGSDPELDELWDACEDGDFDACDMLYLDSPPDSEYQTFGDTCGARNESSGFCVDLYGTGDDGGTEGLTDGTDSPADVEQQLADAYESMLGLDREQAECLASKLVDVVDEGTIDESEAMTEVMDYLADCDISIGDISTN